MAQAPPKQPLLYALFSWKGELRRLPYLRGAVFLFCATYIYSFLAYYAYFIFVAPPEGGITPELIFEAKKAGLLPPVTLLPLVVIFILLDAKRLRSLMVHPALALVNVVSLLPKLDIGLAGQLAVLAMAMYRAALCVLPPRIQAPHVVVKNRTGKGIRVYEWAIREPRIGEAQARSAAAKEIASIGLPPNVNEETAPQ